MDLEVLANNMNAGLLALLSTQHSLMATQSMIKHHHTDNNNSNNKEKEEYKPKHIQTHYKPKHAKKEERVVSI